MHTENETEDAVAYIRQKTSAPIERFLQIAASSRLQGDPGALDGRSVKQFALPYDTSLKRVWSTISCGAAWLMRKFTSKLRRGHSPSKRE